MKKNFVKCVDDSLEFIFAQHETELLRRSNEWFAERLAGATAEERLHLIERAFVRAEHLGADLAKCRFRFSLQRTLRVPDDGRDYPLPAGLGRLPMRSLRLLKSPAIPADWRGRRTGLVCLHSAEAAWLSFGDDGFFALQVAAGGICAVSGTIQEKTLVRDPQNYVVTPQQPWLDGFRVGPQTVRQFVAMPLGKGFTVESQVTGSEANGGMQLRVVPPKIDLLWEKEVRPRCEWRWTKLIAPPRIDEDVSEIQCATVSIKSGFGAGGRIRQKIYADPQPSGTWDESAGLDCELHLIDARHWQEFTGERVWTKPPTPEQYAEARIPWFDYESDAVPLTGPAPLAEIKSVATIFTQKTGLDLPDNDSLEAGETITLGAMSEAKN